LVAIGGRNAGFIYHRRIHCGIKYATYRGCLVVLVSYVLVVRFNVTPSSASFGSLTFDLGTALTNATSIFNSMSGVVMLAISLGVAYGIAKFLVGLIRR
jgi:hypothetical protein